jgi:D-alanine-D-alanine ligase
VGGLPVGDEKRLRALERAIVERAEDLAVFFIYDRPHRVTERRGLARTYFAQRCVSDEQLDLTLDAFRSVGAYVDLFEGERDFMKALAEGRLQKLPQNLKVAFNGIGWGIAFDGFKPGRKALIPLIADSYGIACANSDPYPCALTVHKFDSFLVLDALGVRTPKTWHYRPCRGWIGNRPPEGMRVIAKSTYEAWSVGVTDDSVFHVDESSEERVSAIADDLGQPVTVQEFIPGTEVCVPVLSCPKQIVTPPMEAVMARAPGDPDAIMTINDNLGKGAVSHRPFACSPELMNELRDSALQVFEIFDLRGLTRIDFRVDQEERAWVFDVAIDPGIGLKSSAYLSLAQLGFSHAGFLRIAIAATLATEGRLRL